ncbi:TIGR03085 family metal-binding protein [Nocardia sp. alder85J]|uniref:TIGR03085 family metal-binding protein n=1 Tax=Nocardia sp. alder85J TaxID=2862949 RepID=UPI001CD36022|nr:TIGR03085 family metal-binding protein [Nocardia sp. alder85J]MCX4094292.1 TIGR03085 family metal-binding protein [Nocardia sp. alder85J]
MSLARRERLALVDSMTAAGPEAPTLCGGWTVRDLAAHLVVRERRMDASPGIMLKPLAGYLNSVQAKAAQRPFEQLLEQIRTGPPWWSPMRPLDSLVNLSEMYVHHEDVRRGAPGWKPRELPASDEAELWNTLRRMAKLAYRKSPVGLALATPDGQRVIAHSPAAGEDPVVLTGPPSELVLHAFGRNAVRLDATGPEAAVQAVDACDRSI